MRMLIVEDDADLRTMLEESLSERHAVKVVATAFEALAVHPERFDVIVTDHRLPAMSGIDLRTVLQERGVPVPVVLMSSDPGLGHRAAQLGFCDFLAKPFGWRQLHGVLARIARRLGQPWQPF